MEPHAVVQAGAHEVRVVPAHVVRSQDRVEEGHVRGVGGHAGMQQGVVGQVAVGPDPQPLVRLPRTRVVPGEITDVALVDRMGPFEPVGELLLPGRKALGQRGQALWRGHLGHGELVLEALFGVVKRGRQVEDGAAVLHGDDAPGGERPAVPDAVHLVEDGDRRVAGPQEVRVQRVDPAVLDGASRRHQCLPGHLPAEHTLALLVGLDAPEDVDLNGLEVKQIDEEVQGRAHSHMFAGGGPCSVRARCLGPRYPAAA